ncbi:MAG: ComF family protein [Lachnospiraceae bacterium]|nr:ComF family protein [Lachnospiraceae bacterium]MCD7956546.1 ComF family protein [Lachnospiraceae bacterium]
MYKKKNLIRSTQKICETAAKWLYPPRCPCCDKIRPIGVSDLECVCEDCGGRLPWVREPACMLCGKPLDSHRAEVCRDCGRTRHLFDCGRAAFTYSGKIRHSVYRMKFQNRRDYLDFFAAAMCLALEPYLCAWQPEILVPIPMHARKRAVRGYNQAELLAERISRRTGIPCEKNLLRCVRYTGNQKELDRIGRLKNLRGSFALNVSREGMPQTYGSGALPERVLLVDDVYTTGSTMDEAARALKSAGVRQVYFIVLCTGDQTAGGPGDSQ